MNEVIPFVIITHWKV